MTNGIKPDPDLYASDSPAAAFAAKRDDKWFEDHPTAAYRVRPLIVGESPAVDYLIADDPTRRGFAMVIDHRRNRDRRARAGRGIYPAVFLRTDDGHLQAELHKEVKRWARHFKKSARTPRPIDNSAIAAVHRFKKGDQA